VPLEKLEQRLREVGEAVVVHQTKLRTDKGVETFEQVFGQVFEQLFGQVFDQVFDQVFEQVLEQV
jgi:hypothetical protein